MSALEDALTLIPDGDGEWLASADPRYESLTGMFGGWSLAVVLRGVTDSALAVAMPSAITMNFVARLEPGRDVKIRVQRVGGGRSLDHWRADLVAVDESRTFAQAMVVLADRRDTDDHTEPVMPEAPDPDSLEEFRPPAPAGDRTIVRPISGHPPFGRTSTSSSAWVRETSGREVDHLQLAFLADAYAPRSFFWSDGPRSSATMSLSAYFHGTAEEIADVGDEYVLNEAIGTRGVRSTSGQQARLWSRQGALLATTEQLCWYR